MISSLESTFNKCTSDLSVVESKLMLAFPSDPSANPVKIVDRIRRVSEQLPVLLERLKSIQSSKREFFSGCSADLRESQKMLVDLLALTKERSTNASSDSLLRELDVATELDQLNQLQSMLDSASKTHRS
eukprot:ANDGO_03532.mRNA.1 hypothetical protein